MKQFSQVFVLCICYIRVAYSDDSFCRINGVIYPSESSLGLKVDNCNICSCGSDGIGCTEKLCIHPPKFCQLDDKKYQEEDEIPSQDCKKCNCRNGNVVCYGCKS